MFKTRAELESEREPRHYPRSNRVEWQNDDATYRVMHREWTVLVPDLGGRAWNQTGNFDFHRRRLQKSIRLFGRHLFWWTVKQHEFCYNADNAGCCFGLSFDASTENNFASAGLDMETVKSAYSGHIRGKTVV